jgi:hypothetical protein
MKTQSALNTAASGSRLAPGTAAVSVRRLDLDFRPTTRRLMLVD